MTAAASRTDRIVSAASIDGLWIELPVSHTALTACLQRFGPLRVERGSGSDRDRSWISLEVWTVTNGRLVMAGADQHETAARWAGIGAGVFGAAWGASLGWLAGLPSGNVRDISASMGVGAKKGFELGATLGGSRAREMSRALALGPYHELLVGVPNVSLRGAPGRYTLVLGMVTDDGMARSIDRFFGYGYNKQPGTFDLRDGGSFRVDAVDDSFVSVEIDDVRRPRLSSNSPCGSHLNRRWGLPLLGRLHDGRWTYSRLERRIGTSGAAARQILGRLEVTGDVFGAPLSGRHSLGRRVSSGAHMVLFTGVSSRISQPASLSDVRSSQTGSKGSD